MNWSVLIGLLAALGLESDASLSNFLGVSSDIKAQAQQERKLVIYSVMHADDAVEDLLSHFHQRYPFLDIRNSDGDGAKTYLRFIREVSSGQPSADFIWSSAMDLQEKLINDGYSMSYTTPEMAALPSWAHWQNLGYGVTLEPIVFVYNSRFLTPAEMPRTHAGLYAMLSSQPSKFLGKIAAYDPEKSEVGMLLFSQDVGITKDTWNLFDRLGAEDAHLYTTSRDMLSAILEGRQWMGYDIIASYALELQKNHPELVIVYPTDYVLNLSRVGFITAQARHPNSAKLFLDFLLSREGQGILKRHGMGPVRNDVLVPPEQSRLDPMRTQAIRIGPGLLSDLDSLVRAQFLRRWKQARIAPG